MHKNFKFLYWNLNINKCKNKGDKIHLANWLVCYLFNQIIALFK